MRTGSEMNEDLDMTGTRKKILIGATLALVGAGVTIDFIWANPLLEKTRAMERQRVEALERINSTIEAQAERQALAGALQVADLAELKQLSDRSDPIVFLGRLLDRSGLTRLEMTSTGTNESARLRQTGFTVRATGEYGQIVDFIRTLEQSARLVTVDVLQIQKSVGAGILECRLSLSVFDPLARASS
jgi:Tfp pilus assembly protein PilO